MPSLAAKGGVYSVSEPFENPKLTLFPVSLNSAKGHIYLRMSTQWEKSELKVINFPEENQTLDYARMCPNMTVPILEIDDKIICDSNDMQKYLSTYYPGPGDKAARGKQEAFIEKMMSWDEGLFTYRRMGSIGSLANDLRILRLHQALKKALDENCEDEQLLDGSSILDKYIWKIAQIHHIKEATSGELTPEIQKKMEVNDELEKEILSIATNFLSSSEGSFLFSNGLCSADGFLCAILFRMSESDPKRFESYTQEFPAIAEYWEDFKETEESNCILPYTMTWAKMNALRNGVPFKIIGLKTCWQPPVLPDDVEERILQQLDQFRKEYST
jgi:glutathione S-transferase